MGQNEEKYDFDNGPLINNGPLIECKYSPGKESEDQIQKMLELIDEKNISIIDWYRIINKYKDRYGKDIKHAKHMTYRQASNVIKKIESFERREKKYHCFSNNKIYVGAVNMLLSNYYISKDDEKILPDENVYYIENLLVDIVYTSTIVLREFRDNEYFRNEFSTFFHYSHTEKELDLKGSDELKKEIMSLREDIEYLQSKLSDEMKENKELRKEIYDF